MSTYNIPEAGKASVYDLARVNSQKRQPKSGVYNAVKDAADTIDRSNFHTPGVVAKDAAFAARRAMSSAFGPRTNSRNLEGGRTRKHRRSRKHKRKTRRHRR